MVHYQWYLAKIREPLLGFKRDELVYVRLAKYKVPLAVGNVCVLYQPSLCKSTRLAESAGWYNTFILGAAAPTDKNDTIEGRYRDYLLQHPLAKRAARGTNGSAKATLKALAA